MQILLRAKFDDTEKVTYLCIIYQSYTFLYGKCMHEQSGIGRLLNEGTFSACFPLHEGRYDMPHSTGTSFDRRVNNAQGRTDCFFFCPARHTIYLVYTFVSAYIYIVAVSRVGQTQTMAKATAIVPDPQVFWRQNWIVLLLAGLLHEHAHLSVHCGYDLLHLWPGFDEFG